MGVWHEIARYPHPFQKDCVASRATYSIRDDGKIAVLNECRNASPSGKLRSARATAWVVDPETNAKLKVSFFWPFSGHYWIIDLGKDYEYAVVGHPKRKYLWVLSRTETMEEPVYQGILDRLRAQHYDTERLMKTAPARRNHEPEGIFCGHQGHRHPLDGRLRGPRGLGHLLKPPCV
jgi:apolipoprotein D and lipocalin family protein